MTRFFLRTGFFLLSAVIGLVLLWCAGAIWFDLPVAGLVRQVGAVALFLIGAGLWIFGRRWGRVATVVLIGVVMAWWWTLSPSNERTWQPDVARTAWAEIDGDVVTLHNVRDFEYRRGSEPEARWETRTVRISQLTGIDLAINYWGSPYMAHPIVSFQFADAPPLCFSIETRREVGETYSAIGGFYRRYELIYIVANERDAFRLRTNFHDEDIYLYRLNVTPEQARQRFREYLAALNLLHEQPRWYNAATANCTTSIRAQRDASRRLPWDWRMLVNGYGDEMLYERGDFLTGALSFADLKARSLINAKARAADTSLEFSKAIRKNLPMNPDGGN